MRHSFNSSAHISGKTDRILVEIFFTTDVYLDKEVPAKFWQFPADPASGSELDSPWRISALSECSWFHLLHHIQHISSVIVVDIHLSSSVVVRLPFYNTNHTETV